MTHIRTELFRQEAGKAIRNQHLQEALTDFQGRISKATALAYEKLPDGEALRQEARRVRMRAIENLDVLLETLADRIRARGGRIFFARDAREAVDYCLETARRLGVKRVVKGKSMVTEEIGLNERLQEAGIEVSETDLGEYIVQLAGEHPSHIIAPAVHKTKQEVGALFADKLGIPYSDDPLTLTRAARKTLRRSFLEADMGISGCNLACAETGHITTVSNEGNIRMSTTLPRVHIAIMGMERIAARLEDHDALLRLLSRGAAAQNLAGYVSYLGGPRRDDQEDGPEELHLIVLDNGRSKILADGDFREILCCIRCAACLNVCPVYGKIGGHTYGYAYCGPVGSVLTPLFVGVNRAKDLCLGETLCGACRDACPLHIDIPGMLLRLRSLLADGDARWGVKRTRPIERLSFMLWSRLIRSPGSYGLVIAVAAFLQRLLPGRGAMIARLPYPFHEWTQSRDMKRLDPKPFRERWKEIG